MLEQFVKYVLDKDPFDVEVPLPFRGLNPLYGGWRIFLRERGYQLCDTAKLPTLIQTVKEKDGISISNRIFKGRVKLSVSFFSARPDLVDYRLMINN